MSEKLSIIIPVYNSADRLPRLVKTIVDSLNAHQIIHEIIMVDDGSRDDSWNIIVTLCAGNPAIAGIKFVRNLGQNAAVIAGLQISRYPVAVTLDDDFQHSPQDIPAMLAALGPDVDLVYAGPAFRIHSFYYAALTSLVKGFLALMCGAAFLQKMQTFRLFRTEIYPWKQVAIRSDIPVEGVLALARPRTVKVPVHYYKSERGESTYGVARIAKLVMQVIAVGRKLKSPHTPEVAASEPIAEKSGWAFCVK
jgi:glycosyltransferase involved in cell wall biosynthesis